MTSPIWSEVEVELSCVLVKKPPVLVLKLICMAPGRWAEKMSFNEFLNTIKSASVLEMPYTLIVAPATLFVELKTEPSFVV